MRIVLAVVVGCVLLLAAGSLAWFFTLERLPPAEGIYPAGSKIPDERALGGFGESSNFPKDLTGQDWGRAGEVSLVAFPDEAITYSNRDGFAVRVVNRTDEVVGFTACDSRLYLAQEALDEAGNWRPIELPPIVICGNSFHRVFLEKGQYWEFPALRYRGSFKTRLRFRLEQDEWRPLEADGPEGAGGKPLIFPERGGRVFYSNEFEGWISNSRFVAETRE